MVAEDLEAQVQAATQRLQSSEGSWGDGLPPPTRPPSGETESRTLHAAPLEQMPAMQGRLLH